MFNSFQRDIFLVGILLLCIGGITISVIQKRENLRRLLIEELRCDEFIKIMDKLIENAWTKNLRNQYIVNKIRGLCVKGNYSEAIELCSYIEVNKLSNSNRAIYCIYYFQALIYFERIEEARKFYRDNESDFIQGLKNQNTFFESEAASILYYIYNGDIQKAKEILSALNNNKYCRKYMLYKLVIEFLHGKIEIIDGNVEEGTRVFSRILDKSQNTYITKEIKKHMCIEGEDAPLTDSGRGEKILKDYYSTNKVIIIIFVIALLILILNISYNNYTVQNNNQGTSIKKDLRIYLKI